MSSSRGKGKNLETLACLKPPAPTSWAPGTGFVEDWVWGAAGSRAQASLCPRPGPNRLRAATGVGDPLP